MTEVSDRQTAAFEVETHGIILFTENYDACVRFYGEALGLPVWFQKPPGLTAFRFGNGYLMVETGGAAQQGRKPVSSNPTVLRFNVRDVETAAETLKAKGVAVEIQRFDWGTIGAFCDPDGNPCELKDAFDGDFLPPSHR